MSAHSYSLTHLSDDALAHGLAAAARNEGCSTARLLAHIAEFDARKLCRPAGYRSTFRYCVDHLHLSEDAAYWRIRAARVAQRFPVVFAMVADGRLHLTGIVQLHDHLTEANAEELFAAATHKSRREIELVLALRFPQADVATVLRPVCADSSRELVPAPVFDTAHSAPEHAPAAPPPSRVTPLAPERFAFQTTIAQATHDKLRHVQDLLGHRVPAGDLAAVLDLALDALVEKLEKQRCAATSKPHAARATTNARHVPAPVRRAVWKRDGGRCTFVGDTGHRCDARGDLELDHVIPVARGGESTVDNLRLRCRAHNQLDAERTFGAAFMAARRERAGAVA